MNQPSLCMVTTLKTSLEKTLAFTYYHLNNGVDHVYLFFDDPQDPAVDILAPEPRVTCIRCDTSYWEGQGGWAEQQGSILQKKQSLNSKVAIERARNAGFEWIAHIDSDELMYAVGGLKQAISNLPQEIQVGRFAVLEAIAEMDPVKLPFRDLHFFKHGQLAPVKKKFFDIDDRTLVSIRTQVIIYRLRSLCALLLGCSQLRRDFIKGHFVGKCIARTSAPIDCFYPHFPIPVLPHRLRLGYIQKAHLLHFIIPDYPNWLGKRGKAYQDYQINGIPHDFSKHLIRQYEEFISRSQKGDEQELVEYFRSRYLFSTRQLKVLRALGLVSEIHLPGEIFKAPVR